MAEQIQEQTFSDVFYLYNSDPGDDPGGVGTAQGAGFLVEGLSSRSGDADGVVGRIAFPSASLGGSAVSLREDVSVPALGTPRDLNGDGLVDTLDHSADYIVLPVSVHIEWVGAAGNLSAELHLLLANGS